MTDAPVNVRAYGAKGDGTTDDRAAFNLALVAAAGKTLYVPAGSYRVSAGLTVSNRTRIVGDGPTASLINYRPTVTSDNQLFDFDNVFTAPLHGFKDTDDYWSRGSAKPHLRRIRIPCLLYTSDAADD